MNHHLASDSLVYALAVWLEANGYMVGTCLDKEEHQKPPPLNGFRPDIYALRRGSPSVLGVVELCERLDDEFTQERWKALFAATDRPGSHPGYELHIMVPNSCLAVARQQAMAWDVTASIHTEKLIDQPGLGGGQ